MGSLRDDEQAERQVDRVPSPEVTNKSVVDTERRLRYGEGTVNGSARGGDVNDP